MANQFQETQSVLQLRSLITCNAIAQTVALLAMSPYLLGFVRARTTLLDYVLYLFIVLLLTGGLFLLQLSTVKIIKKFSNVKLLRGFVLSSSTLIWFLMILDVVIVSKFGLHLDSRIVLEAFSVKGMNFGISIDAASMAAIVLTIGTLFVIQLRLLHAMRIHSFSDALQKVSASVLHPLRVLIYCAGLATLLGAFEVAADPGTVPSNALPVYSSLVQRLSSYPNLRLKIESNAVKELTMERRPHIFMVLAESFRWDLIRPEITPNLYRLAQSKHCVAPERSYAGGHMTWMGAFSFLYGHESYLTLPFTTTRTPSQALGILRDNGYQIAGFDVSGVQSYSPPVLQAAQFDSYKEYFNVLRTEKDDRNAIEGIRDYLKWNDPSHPQFLFLFLFSTHHPYLSPKDSPSLSFELPLDPSYPPPAPNQIASYSAYLKSAAYIDKLIGELLQNANEWSDNLVFAFAGDHGEEFGEFGSIGHANVRFEDVRTRVPNILCFPKGASNIGTPAALSSNADIFPTILNWAGLSETKLESIFSGKSILGNSKRTTAWISGASFPTGGREAAVVGNGLKIQLTFPEPTLTSSRIIKTTSWTDQEIILNTDIEKRVGHLREESQRELFRFLEDGSEAKRR